MNDMYDFWMTTRIVCIDSNDLSNLAILKTLKVLRILIVLSDSNPPSSPAKIDVIIISKIESSTILPSKMLIESVQYFFNPYAIFLLVIS
jgi:hypothetical protein